MLGAAIALGLSLTSCSQDPLNENPTQKQEGRLLLTLKTDANFGQKANVAQSRAVNEESYKKLQSVLRKERQWKNTYCAPTVLTTKYK